MNFIKYFISLVIICFTLFVSCDNDNTTFPVTEVPEDTTYNFAYEDSIVFNSYDSSYFRFIYISSIDGIGIRPLTTSIVSYNPAWSPNKRKIIFIGTSIGLNNWGLYQMNVSDYKIKRISVQDSRLNCAAYSPDMKYIAYSIFHESNTTNKVKLYNISTQEVKDLTDWITDYVPSLSWSPNSKEILINDGYVINIETPGLTQLFTHSNPIYFPNWSPDGRKISFSSAGPRGYSNIFIRNLDTGVNNVVYIFAGTQSISTWSKDNNQIIFEQYSPSIQDPPYLCKANINGTNFIQITSGTKGTSSPCWYK